MKRVILILIATMIIAPLGLYWHTLRQLEAGLERIAGRLAPIGRMEWDRIRLDRHGVVHIERAEMALPESRDRVHADRIQLSSGGLWSLPALAHELNALRLPESMSLAIEGLYLPVNRELDRWIGQTSLALPFPAAGCGEFEQFRFYDFGELKLVQLIIDYRLELQPGASGNELEIRQRLRARDLGDRRTQLRLISPVDPINLDELPQLLANAHLTGLDLEYLDQGFYPRLLAFCADQTGSEPGQQIEHHVEAWTDRWLELGLLPGPLALIGYRHFLAQPDLIRVQVEHPDGLRLAQMNPGQSHDWLPGIRARFTIDEGTEIDIGAIPITLTRPIAREEPVSAEPPSAEIRSEREITLGTPTDWREITTGQVDRHLGQRARIQTRDGQQYSGRIAAVDESFLHLTSRSRVGEFTRPIPRSDIEWIQVRP